MAWRERPTEGMRNLQPEKSQDGEVKVEDVVDNRIMRKLDESGFIERTSRHKARVLNKPLLDVNPFFALKIPNEEHNRND
jgi:hypothetical protein